MKMYSLKKVSEIRGWGKKNFGLVNAVAFLSSGDLAVLDAANNRVCIFDKDLKELESFGCKGFKDNQLHMPVAMEYDSYSGWIFIGDWFNHKIKAFSVHGKLMMSLGHYGTPGRKSFVQRLYRIFRTMPSDSNSLVFRNLQRLGNMMLYAGSYLRKDGITSFYDRIMDNANIMIKPDGFALTKDRIFATDHYLNCIYVIDKVKQKIIRRFAGDILNRPSNLCIDRRKWLYVSDTKNHEIKVFDRNQRLVDRIKGKKTGRDGFFPFGIKNVSGKLIVCGMDMIQIIDPDTHKVLFVKRGKFNQLHGIDILRINKRKYSIIVADRLNHRAILFLLTL